MAGLGLSHRHGRGATDWGAAWRPDRPRAGLPRRAHRIPRLFRRRRPGAELPVARCAAHRAGGGGRSPDPERHSDAPHTRAVTQTRAAERDQWFGHFGSGGDGTAARRGRVGGWVVAMDVPPQHPRRAARPGAVAATAHQRGIAASADANRLARHGALRGAARRRYPPTECHPRGRGWGDGGGPLVRGDRRGGGVYLAPTRLCLAHGGVATVSFAFVLRRYGLRSVYELRDVHNRAHDPVLHSRGAGQGIAHVRTALGGYVSAGRDHFAFRRTDLRRTRKAPPGAAGCGDDDGRGAGAIGRPAR